MRLHATQATGSLVAGSEEGKGMTIRIFLVDDHALVRAGIRMILAGEVISFRGETGV